MRMQKGSSCVRSKFSRKVSVRAIYEIFIGMDMVRESIEKDDYKGLSRFSESLRQWRMYACFCTTIDR